MQGDIENVPSGALKPRSQAAKLIVVFKKEHLVSVLRKVVRPCQSAQARADDDHIVFFFNAF